MPEPIVLGSQIDFRSASALLLTGEYVETNNPVEFSKRLISAYKKPDPEEIPGKEGFIRIGYQYVSFDMKPADGDPFTLCIYPYNCYDNWPQYGGPPIIGDPDMHLFTGVKWQLPAVTLPGHTGKELGERMKVLAKGPTVALIEIRHRSLGPVAYTDCVALRLEPNKGMIGRGTVHLLRNHTDGEIWSELYELEGGNSERGRGDHVGAYPSRTFGL